MRYLTPPKGAEEQLASEDQRAFERYMDRVVKDRMSGARRHERAFKCAAQDGDQANMSELVAAYRRALRHDFMVFYEKCFALLEPGTAFLDNWHLHAIAYSLCRVERDYAPDRKRASAVR